jgi:hypothetical protein
MVYPSYFDAQAHCHPFLSSTTYSAFENSFTLLVVSNWLLVIGYWLLVIGYWLLVIGY